MKFIVVVLALTSLVNAARAEEIRYGSYEIVGEVAADDTQATYVITHNPPMAVLIIGIGPEVVKAVAAGTLRDCKQLTDNQVANINKRVERLSITIAQVEMAIRMSGIDPNDPDVTQIYRLYKPMSQFVKKGRGNPYYGCKGPSQ